MTGKGIPGVTFLLYDPESVKLNMKKGCKPFAAMDCGFCTFHPMGETTKMDEVVAAQGIERLFADEFHGFRFLIAQRLFPCGISMGNIAYNASPLL